MHGNNPAPPNTPTPPGSFRPQLCQVAWCHQCIPAKEVLSLTWSLSFSLQPIQRLEGKPENAFDRKTAHLLALRTSGVLGAPDTIRPTVRTLASFHLPPVLALPRRSSPTMTPPPVLTLSTQPKVVESPGETSAPGNLGTYFSMSARLSLIPQVLTTPGLPTKGALHSTSSPTSPTTKEPRGDV